MWQFCYGGTQQYQLVMSSVILVTEDWLLTSATMAPHSGRSMPISPHPVKCQSIGRHWNSFGLT